MSGFTKKQLLDDSKFLRSMAEGGLDGSADNKTVWDRLDAIAERLESILTEQDVKKHRFIEVAEDLGKLVAAIRGKKGRNFIRDDHGRFGPLLDELDAAYARWLKGEPGGHL